MNTNIKAQLNDLITRCGLKHWSFGLKKDAQLFQDVMTATTHMDETYSLSDRVYHILSGENFICKYGNRKKLKTITTGTVFCGRASVCQCAKESVSANLKNTLSSKTLTEVEEAKRKRAITNLEKYGHENAGQSTKALHNHREFYNNDEKVTDAVNKQRSTLIEKYGVDSSFKLPHVRQAGYTGLRTSEYRKTRSIMSKDMANKGHYLKCGYDNVVARLIKEDLELITPFEKYNGVMKTKYDFRCMVCSHNFSSVIYGGRHRPKCRACNPYEPVFASRAENELATEMLDFGYVINRARRDLIPHNYEIDIYLPELKLAVEYCGLFWHAEFANGKTKDYHQRKMKLCNTAGIRLVTIFEDEYRDKPLTVINRLAQICMALEIRDAHAAEIRDVAVDDCSEFLNEYHIQGDVSGDHRLGLYFDNELYAVMVFEAHQGVWNLKRYAARVVVKGASRRIYDAFVTAYNPTTIEAICDLRWQDENFYKALGFKPIGEPFIKTYLMKQYINRLDPIELQDGQTMTDYDKIHDCGNQRYEWTKS